MSIPLFDDSPRILIQQAYVLLPRALRQNCTNMISGCLPKAVIHRHTDLHNKGERAAENSGTGALITTKHHHDLQRRQGNEGCGWYNIRALVSLNCFVYLCWLVCIYQGVNNHTPLYPSNPTVGFSHRF